MTLPNTLLLIFLMILLVILTWYRAKAFINPFSMMVLFFFLPLLVSTLDIGVYSIRNWNNETVSLLITTALAWGLFPLFWLTFLSKPKINTDLRNLQIVASKLYKPFVFGLSFLYVGLCLIENKVLSGSFIPILVGGEVAHEVHVLSLPVLGLITRGGSMVCALLLIGLRIKRSSFDILLLVFVLLLPLSRGSRLDIVFSMVVLIILASVLFRHKLSKLKIIYTGLSVVALVLVMTFIGTFRSQDLDSNYSYAGNLGFDSESIVANGLAPFYGNLVLPFINLDRFVSANSGQYTYGEFTLLPISASVINFPELFKLNSFSSLRDYEDPVSRNGVSTALSYFYKDFGPYWSVLPLSFYMIVWIILFNKRFKNPAMLVIYGMYSSSFCLSAFMAFILNPSLYRRFIIVMIIFWLISLFLNQSKLKRRRMDFKLV